MIAAALRTRVLAASTVSALIGQRMHLSEAPLESSRPLVVYRLISTQPVQFIRGASPLVRYWFQIGARAETPGEALELADLIRAQLDGYAPPPGGEIEAARWLNRITGWDPTLETHSVDDDFAVWATP